MRGTAGITVGFTSDALSMILSMDSTNAQEQPVASHAAWITFANECAIGRNSRMTSSGR